MGFFGYNIVKKHRQEIEDYIDHRLPEFSTYGPSEIKKIYYNSEVPLEDLMDVMEILYENEISLFEKASLLKEIPYGMEVLVVIATMER
ncbi:hypothetical protein LV84_01404 [Algoriphagus ratkowskyi]|uniref:Uncharacterized protein n=1 Tax=Algoriphagus ratkowskyi TaxID=57028 RepID=A0A2W7REN6_9BACT|nr:hypothetical protein [Algoriphagus ratkowskyi]PZX59373.1 hypothetical protein LV84_01404 [Algoriphagus ratkowskyi]TXD77363.1 hypothetical protein ESW18_11165 [Algoriphagus ratkowskyi]